MEGINASASTRSTRPTLFSRPRPQASLEEINEVLLAKSGKAKPTAGAGASVWGAPEPWRWTIFGASPSHRWPPQVVNSGIE